MEIFVGAPVQGARIPTVPYSYLPDTSVPTVWDQCRERHTTIMDVFKEEDQMRPKKEIERKREFSH